MARREWRGGRGVSMICVLLFNLIDSVPSGYAESRYFLQSPSTYKKSCALASGIKYFPAILLDLLKLF